MAVKLRLVRMGKKKQPTYRVVAAESRRARSGAFLEIVGTYQPRGVSAAEPETVLMIDNDKVVHWLSRGRPAHRARGQAAQDQRRARRVRGVQGREVSESTTSTSRATSTPSTTTTRSSTTTSSPTARRPSGPSTATAVLEYIAKSLADDPDAVVGRGHASVRARSCSRSASAPSDMGRIIGRRGRTAQAIRALVGAAGARDGVTTSVDIVD